MIAPGIESATLLVQTDLAATLLDIAGCGIPADMRQDDDLIRGDLLDYIRQAIAYHTPSTKEIGG